MNKTALASRQEMLMHALALWHIPGMHIALVTQLIAHFGSVPAIFLASTSELLAFGLKPEMVRAILSPDKHHIEEALLWQEKEDCHIVHWQDEAYPALLRETHSPPWMLFVRGDVELLSKTQLAMVGSRHATQVGLENAFEFAKRLSSVFVITSGFALGVDGASHRGALKGGGKTVAVMGAGLNTIYPRRHKLLVQSVVDNGALVSEFPLHVGVLPMHFPRRNRIISSLSLGVLVVEAALKSGSLITASLSLEAGREVYAIPGSIHNRNARGCHRLLADGATLVQSPQDIIDMLLPSAGSVKLDSSALGQGEVSLDDEYRLLLSYIDENPVSINVLVHKTGFDIASLSSMLLILELDGYVKTQGGSVECTQKKYQPTDL